MSVQAQVAPGNALLEQLPADERRRFIAGCAVVELIRGEQLCGPTQRLDRVYFPMAGFVSLTATVDEASNLQVGLIGNEGVVGGPLALGAMESSVRAVVLGSGSALCMNTAAFSREINRSKPLARLMDHYVSAQLSQLAQLVACTRFHAIDARLARLLLTTQDRAHADEFFLTHELLGAMLGVRRVGITKAASALQQLKIILYSRGRITILDRPALQATACSCYEAERNLYATAVG